MAISRPAEPKKTKPIKAKIERNEDFFAYDAKDCHSPSGLAITLVSLLLCALVPMTRLKKQSQFAPGELSQGLI
jgi:hypothetical protein